MNTNKAISQLLIELYKDIVHIEEKSVINGEFGDITVNDMHVMEVIGEPGDRTSSSVSKALGITMGSLTKAIDALVKKGYVARRRAEHDKRVVLLSLQEKGIRALRCHSSFHENVTEEAVGQLDLKEKQMLENSLCRLKLYFDNAALI